MSNFVTKKTDSDFSLIEIDMKNDFKKFYLDYFRKK